ncbi:hypothetical protein ACOSQ4_032976 [Xanthoceras sorbifolium]
MGTRNQTNAEFRNEVHEILGHHESSIDQVHATLQTVLTELQSLRTSQNHSQPLPDINPFIFKAEQYFEFKEVAFKQQVQLASFHLEGITLQWHRWLAKFKGPVTWMGFTKALLLRFGPTGYEDPSEALTRHKQTTTLSAYQEEFKKLSHKVDELPEIFLIGCFVVGLKDDIRLDVKIKQPCSLTDAIGVARLVEERNGLQKKGVTNFRGSIFGVPPKSSSNSLAGILGPAPGQKPSSELNAFRKITSQEVRKYREKGSKGE